MLCSFPPARHLALVLLFLPRRKGMDPTSPTPLTSSPSILTSFLTSPHHPGLFALGRSGISDEDTTPANRQFSGLLPGDESVSSDYFSDFFDIDQIADIESGGGSHVVGVDDNNEDDDEDDDDDILTRHPPARPRQSTSSRQPPAQSASQPLPTTSRPYFSSGSQRSQPRSGQHGRRQYTGSVGTVLPPLAPQALNHSDSAINIDDDDDDLEFLGQNDFSSPSILNDTPLQGTPSRVSNRIILSPDDEAMPQTRRRAAASRSVPVADPFPLPLPGDPVAPTTATPLRSRTRAGSNALNSPAVTTTLSAARSSSKRRRSNDPGVGSSSTTLPPIATLLASVGNSSSSSRAAGSTHGDSQTSSSSSSGGSSNINATSQSSRPRISPKRPRRNEPIILDDDLFGSDDDDGGVEMVNLVDVDRPRVAKVEDETAEGKAKQEDEGAVGAAGPLGEVAPKKNLTKLSAQQCVICMDDMTDITVTHCGKLPFLKQYTPFRMYPRL